MTLLFRLLRLGVGLAVFALSSLCIAAFFGFLVPLFDLFNHFQVLLFCGSVLALVLVPLAFVGSRVRWPLTAYVALGLFASAVIVVPETLAALAPRPPLPTDGRPVIKMMTHNMFGMNYDMQRMANFIGTEKPDIIAFQEFFQEQYRKLDPLLKPIYPYSIHCEGGKRANIGLYSKIPFTELMSGACEQDAAKGQRTARILGNFTLPNGTRFSVITTHLDWPAQINSASPLTRQAAQFADLATAVRATTGPLILVGDMNSTPWSYAQRDFATAAGLQRQTHNMLTYPARFSIRGWRDTIPFLPLDQVMTRGVTVHDLHIGNRTGSDHLPVLFSFSIPPAGG